MYLSYFIKGLLKTNPMLVLLILVGFSGRSQISEALNMVNVLEANESELSISQIADDIVYIPLDNYIPLAYIMKVVYRDGDYFVKDNKSTFLRFNQNGEQINSIGKRGRGPGEYMYIVDFVVHPETGNIFIISDKEGKMLVYSAKGKFVKAIELTKRHAKSIGISADNLFLFYLDGREHNEENMELLDVNGNLIKSYTNNYKFERGKGILGLSGECLMYSFEDKLHFKEIFSDTLFYLEGANLVPKIILNSGEKRFTPEKRTQAIADMSLHPKTSSEKLVRSVLPNNLLETRNFLFYSYGYERKVKMLVCSKSSGENMEIVRSEGIKNDLDGGPNIDLKMTKDDNTVLSWINAYELKQFIESKDFKNSTPKYPEKKKELENLANSLDENDNPVLMLVKLKN